MKKILVFISLAVLFAACKKSQTGSPSVPNNKMAGKWNIVSVTVTALDSTKTAIPSKSYVYTPPAGWYFQFNTDGTWREQLAPDSVGNLGEGGNYVAKSDTGFVLSNSNPLGKDEDCTIYTLTPTLFVFSHQRAAKFDAVQTPGYLKYVFKLTR